MEMDGRLGYFAWPTVSRLKNGTYIVGASGYRMRHVCPFGRVTMSYSLDGELYTPAGVVADVGLDMRDAGLLTLQSGKVLLSTFTCPRETQKYALDFYENDPAITGLVGKYVDWTPESVYDEFLGGLLCESDDGIHFSKPRNIGISSPHGPLQMKNGRVVYVGTRKGKGVIDNEIWLTYSDDEGKTWSEYTKIPVFDEDKLFWCEPHAIEAEENHLIIAIRVQSVDSSIEGISLIPLTTYLCHSYDGGKTFTKPKPTGVIGAPPHLLKTKSGKIVLTYGRRELPMGIRAIVSCDNGETWSDEIVLTDDATHIDLGYPSTVERDDNSLLTVYYRSNEKGENSSLRYIIWEL